MTASVSMPDAANMSRIPARGALRTVLPRPRTTVRWRLTVLYGALFLASGAVLLAITYVLVSHAALAPVKSPAEHVSFVTAPPRIRAALRSLPGELVIKRVGERQRISDLHQLVIESGVALAIMALLSALLGWVVAGRVLSPLRTITATTQQISETNLHERLELAGPPDELKQLADTIDQLLARLETAFEAQRLFVANASHELRTPLAFMRTTLDVTAAKPGGVPPQFKALDANLRVGLDQADRLLESFLLLARAQHGELCDESSVALDQIISAALATRADPIAAKQLEVHANVSSLRVSGSETLLARMIENVIENAVRHNQPHGRIDISCQPDAGQARLLIDNTGPLLDQHAVAGLAQPFRRLGQQRTATGTGHGLGLSIVAAIAAAHGGSLQLHVRPQGGLRVEITLPHATITQPAPISA
jgi:signal transduction histidine kinase